jgi:hypothetical protein
VEGHRERKREQLWGFVRILVEKRDRRNWIGYGSCRGHLIRLNDLGSCALSYGHFERG